MNCKIALILNGDRPLSTYPSVYNTANLLTQNGYAVTLFFPADMKVDYEVKDIEILKFKRTKPVLIGIFRALLGHARKYALLISFQAEELIASGLVNIIYKIPFVYFSLEIVDFDQIKTIKDKIKKYFEIFFNKRASFTVIQDEIRKRLIKQVNSLDESHLFCIPNSYIGTLKGKTTYLRDKYKISSDKIIILYAGGIEAWAIDRTLIESVCEWDNKYILVLHGWSRDGYLQTLNSYIDKINTPKKKIYISLGILNEEEYGELVTSADIGLVWYKIELPNNVAKMGLSSGKLASFLRCGLPVIVPSYLEGLNEMIPKYQFGILANSESEIKNAAVSIMENYQV